MDELEEEDNIESQEKKVEETGETALPPQNEMEEDESEDEDSDHPEDVSDYRLFQLQLADNVQNYVPGAVTHLRRDPQYLTHIEVYRIMIY